MMMLVPGNRSWMEGMPSMPDMPGSWMSSSKISGESPAAALGLLKSSTEVAAAFSSNCGSLPKKARRLSVMNGIVLYNGQCDCSHEAKISHEEGWRYHIHVAGKRKTATFWLKIIPLPSNQIFCLFLLSLLPSQALAQRLPKPDVLHYRGRTRLPDRDRCGARQPGLDVVRHFQGVERYDGLNFVELDSNRQADFYFPGEVVLDEGLIIFDDSTLWAVADGNLLCYRYSATNTIKDLPPWPD